MKKLLLVCALLPAALLSAVAQDATSAINKLNLVGRNMLLEYKQQRNLLSCQGREAAEEPQISAIVIFRKGVNVEQLLSNYDVEILTNRRGVVVVSCSITVCEQLAELSDVISIGFGDKLTPALDFARSASLVKDVQEGFSYNGETMSFDGTGVVCGMMDTGLEGNHINFKNEDGTSRIKRLWHMNSTDGSSEAYTDETISNFTTDKTTETHATHVAGIIGGGYKGSGTFAKMSEPSSGPNSVELTKNPFYGVATGADLAFAVGELYTENIIKGVTNIIDYAQEQGQPVAVNLSLRNNIGPHDGSDYYTQALARLGEDGIICMSAGNEGGEQMSITKALTNTGNGAYLRTVPVGQDANGFVYDYADGVADLWTNGEEPVTVKLRAYSGSFSTAIDVLTSINSGTVYSSSSTEFSKYFSGSASLQSYVDSSNNRYRVYMSFSNIRCKSSNTTHHLVIEVSGTSGTKLYLYGNGVFFENRVTKSGGTSAEMTKGSDAQSINDGACGDNVISVGAYVSRTHYGVVSGDAYYKPGTEVGDIAPFSSYGTTYKGVGLPHVCAPGVAIISSYSGYYVSETRFEDYVSGKVEDGSKNYYWAELSGTSMSCPYVTGVVGLWLQADPTLDFARILETIKETSTAAIINTERWGAGSINALEGIKYVLENRSAGIGDVWVDDAEKRLVVTATGNGYDVFVAGAEDVTVTLYDMQGRAVETVADNDGNVVIATSDVQKGVYILEARGADFRFTRKIAIR